MENKYFHELTKEEYEAIIALKGTWKEVMDKYKQPDWCGMHNALGGRMGCWSLTCDGTREQISEKFCSDCDYNKKNLEK